MIMLIRENKLHGAVAILFSLKENKKTIKKKKITKIITNKAIFLGPKFCVHNGLRQ